MHFYKKKFSLNSLKALSCWARGGGCWAGTTPFLALLPLPQAPSAGTGVASLHPLCPPAPAASLCTEQFLKWKLRHNIHWTGTHTCTRASAPKRGRTSAALGEHQGMHMEPLLARRAGSEPCLGPHSPHLLPTNCPASCQREGVDSTEGRAGWEGQRRAVPVGGPGTRKAALGAQRERTEVDSWPQKPEVLRTPWLCPSRSFKAPGLGVGLTLQLWPASPHRAHTWYTQELGRLGPQHTTSGLTAGSQVCPQACTPLALTLGWGGG